MNHHEAKFLLRAYRPDSGDAGDPVFAGALDAANHDPALQAWLEREQAFDRALGAKLRGIQPPPGLRDAILAGSRASRHRRSRWKIPAWLAAAACIALAFTLFPRTRPIEPSAREFAEFALNELATSGSGHNGHRADLSGLQAHLASASLPLSDNPGVSGDELRDADCRVIKFAGHDVFEVCFQRDGHWYHLYALRIENLAPGAVDARSMLTSRGLFATTAWKDARFAYALVTHDGAEALRKLI